MIMISMKFLLFLHLIHQQFMAIVPCNDSLTDLGWLLIDATSTQCDDNRQEDYSTKYKYTDYPIFVGDGVTRYKTASNLNLNSTACGITCDGCWNEEPGKCIFCSKTTRGVTKTFPTMNDILVKAALDCSCANNMVEQVPQQPQCQCKATNYYQAKGVLNTAAQECFQCPINYAKCNQVYLGTEIVPTQCAQGIGRQTLQTSSNCSCMTGYKEFWPQQKDCKPLCSPPCATCVGDSSTQCATCQDSLMTINNATTCVCPSNYYMDSTKLSNGDVDKNFCVLCHYSCNTCAVSSTNCISCSMANGRVMSSGSCPCQQFYFETYNQPQCTPCHWTCATCSSTTSCSSCVDNSNRETNYALYQDYFCNCKVGYAEDITSSACLPCQSTCLTCVTTTDTCSSCDVLKNRELVNYRCLCFPRYYEVPGDTMCEQCAPTCLSCDGDNDSSCLSCLPSSFRILNSQRECQCKEGYGYDHSMSEQCLQCVGLCKQCDYYDNCILCPDGINRILDSDNICSCDNGFYEEQSTLICKPCHYSCLTCDQNGQYNCLTCNAEMGRVLKENDKSCDCQPGYFEFYRKCIPCYYTCQTCVSQFKDGCTSCPSSRILSDQSLQHSECVCKSVSQIDDGKSLECTDCHYSCLTCAGPEMNNCLSCYDNSNDSLAISRLLKYGICSCPNNWYDDQINEKCLKCHISCETCFFSDQYSCITCSDADHRIQLSNSCFCQDGYFENLTTLICEACEYKCATCKLDKTNCLTCQQGSLRTLLQQADNIDYKTCQCPATAPNDVVGNPVCQTCHFSCQNCTDKGQNQCTLCDSTANRVIQTDADGSQCVCALQYYEIQTPECAQCSSYCLGCVDTATNCTSCNPQQFRTLDGNKCLCASRFGTQQLSYYDNLQDPECIACHYSCYTCNGPQYNQCLTCSDLDFRAQQGSECVCKPKYIDNGEGVCMTCNQTCETCAGQKNLCTSCPLGSLRTLNVQSQSCDCPLGYFDSGAQICEQCDVTCASCTNQSTTCLSCVQGSNRTLNQLSDTCDCLSGYYDLGTGVCAICHYTCLQCSGPSSSECISCPDFTATKRGLIGQSCLCPDSYFDDQKNQLCQPCSSTCQNCQFNQNSCTLCVVGQNRILSGQQCVCQSSFYESGSPACSKCSNLCQECQINSTTCTQCDSSLNRTLDQAKCNCNFGYFDDGTLLCKQCHYSCQTCAISEQNCTSCDSQNFRELISNKCACLNGTTDQGIALCQSCDTRCQTCTNITTQCLSCNTTLFRVQSGYNCNCKDGYYENNIKQCVLCDVNCLTCQTTSTTCLSCNLSLNKTLDSNQKCICKNGYYADSNDICQQCSSKCQTCTQNATKCTNCFTDRIISNNICNCFPGYYDSASGCQRCSYQCSTCQNTATQCLSCDPISQRTLSSIHCLCNPGYFDIGAFICVQCSQTCLTCISSNNNCQSCDNTLNRILNGSSCDCMPGYYSPNQDKQCLQCNFACKTCIDSATKCTSCDISTSFRIDQSNTFNKCPCINGFYDDGTLTCKKCSYKCINCVGSQDNCTLCYANPGYFRENISPLCNCQAGYYDDGIQIICQKCDPKCQTCLTSSTNCLICESQPTRLTIPQCNCKPGYYEDIQKKCQLCSSNCLTCQNNSSNCLTCQPDRITKECVCQDGYYEANLPLCQACSYKCSTCAQDPLNCLTCASDRENSPNCLCKYHYYDDLVNPLCQECDQYCGKCDLNGCIDCAGNRIQSGKTCNCPVNSISYTYTPYCSNCDVAVINGLFSDDLSQVIYTFEYGLQFNFPLQVDVQAYCSYVVIDKSLQLLGEAPQCQIEEKQLIISLGSGSSVKVGDVIQFNSTILKHIDCTGPLQFILKTELQPPINLIKPSIKINYPQVPVSPCAPIDVRIEQQFVNGERNLQLTWSSSLSISSIDQANQLQFQTLTIEQGQVPQNSEIDITIKFTNFLAQSDQITIKFQTLSASVPQFSFRTIKNTFVSWVPIKILVYYANTICTGGQMTTLNNPVQVKFEEIVQNRQPTSSNAVKFQQSLFTSSDSEGMISTIIPSRTLSVNSNYSILSTFIDLTTNQMATAQLDLSISRSPLMVEIVGGSRIQNYLKAFKIEIQSKDPDIQTEWNQDPEITLLVECIDLQHNNKPCADQSNKTVPLNKTSNIQYIAQRLFTPFTVLLFRVNCSKLNQPTVSASAAIIMLDAELPSINISYPAGYNIRDVNINEKLSFQIILDKDQQIKDMDFSFALVYNYEIVHVKRIPTQNLTFAIWEGFQKFSFINQISIRFQAHDLRYLMPQIGSVTLSVNMPPVNSIISVIPQNGQALFTQYNFRVTNAKDTDSPIQYRFAYYQSQSLYQEDILTGDQDNLIILQDFTTQQVYKSILESGNLTLLISVSDSLGSTVNYTQQIKSQSFYEQWQLLKEENITTNSSLCKQQVKDLQFSMTDPQQLMITALELIKLLNQSIQKDCLEPIYSMIKKIQSQLFEMMLQQANSITQARISNVLAQIYQLPQVKQTRRLQQDEQMCYNSSNNQIQFKQLTKISSNVTDSEEIVKNISQINKQIQKAVAINRNLSQDQAQIQDIGDDYTARSLIQNQELRKSLLRILGGLYNEVYEQKLTISDLVNQLMNSFQQNLALDNSVIKVQTNGFGLQISKIGQKSYQKFLIQEPFNPEYMDLSNFTINRYIQLVKYKSNKYFYTNQFQQTFKNNTLVLNKKETSKYKYQKSITPFFESYMFDPQIYVDNKEMVNLVKYIHQGKLAFSMGTQLQICNDSSTYDSVNSYNFICSSFIKEQWQQEACQIETFKDKRGLINFRCLCKNMDPLTLMIMNVSNLTKQQTNETKQTPVNPEEFINISFDENVSLYMIIFCIASIIIMKIIMKIKKQEIDMGDLRIRFKHQRQGSEILEITKTPKMSMPVFKQNFKYLHEISRILYINYMLLGFSARIILASTSINILITSIHIFNVVLKHSILSVGISLMITMFFQVIVKVLEGFLTGPTVLKIIGFVVTILLNLGIISLNILINSSQYNPFVYVIQTIVGLALLYGPLEIMIQYVRLTLAFTIFAQLKLDPLNPVINLIYYFLQDEIIISIVQGEQIY